MNLENGILTKALPATPVHESSVDVSIYNLCKVFCQWVKLMTQASYNPKWLLSSVMVEKQLKAGK